MSISRDQALEVFHRRYPPNTVHSFTITDTLPDRCRGYSSMDDPPNCWFILFLEEPLPMRFGPSRIVVVSKRTGEVFCDAVANDEG
jgi:hypothetical protein